MSFLRRISRIISLKKVKLHKKREKTYQKFLKKIAIGSASLGFLAYTNLALGSTITAHGGATTVTQISGDKYKVTTTQQSGTNAFNSFSEFNLSTGHNINLFLPSGTNNLINFVNSQIQIDGTLNAIKDNEIGGNLFFLSSQGIAVGSGGIINCGAFFAMTPTQDFMDKFVKDNTLQITGNANEIGYITNRKFVNHNGVVSDEGIPLNNDASIVIAGQINAIDNVGLTSHEITISNGSLVQTGVTNFSGLVNASNLPVGCQTSGLSMTSTADGNIEIVAIADNKDGISAVSEKIANEFTNYTKAEANAKVTVNGSIEAKRDVTIEAVAVNGELKDIDINFKEYGEIKPQEKYDSAKFVSNINATVEFGTTANVDANRSLVVNAISRNFYTPSSINALDLGLSVLGMASPINIAAEVAVADSKAEVLVNSKATLHASEDINITADSKTEVSVGASTTIAKIKKNGGGLSAGVVYADVNSEANVIIEGSVTAGESGVTDKGNVTIEAKSTNNTDITGATKTANDNAFFALGAVIANGSNNSKVEVKNTATVTAEKDLSLAANTESDVTTEAIAETGNESHFGVAVNVTDFKSDSVVKIDADLSANNGDIDIESNNLILQYRSVARSTTGYTVLGQALANAESNLVSGLFSKASFTSKFTDNLGSEAKNKFKAAGAILFNEGSNNSTINVGSDVKISAKEEVNIKASSIVEDYYLQSVSMAVSQLDDANGASAGIMSTDLEQNSTIQFADSKRTDNVCNALVTGSKVNITTLNKIEYNRISRMIQAVKDAWEMLEGEVSTETWDGYVADLKTAWNEIDTKFSTLGTEGLTTEENIKTFMDAISSIPAVPVEILDMVIGGSTAVVRSAAKVVSNASDFLYYRNYLNMYVSSAIKGQSDGSAIGLAGAVGLNDFTAKSEVILGRNTKIETINPTEDNAISINASTDIENIGAAGHIIPSTSATSFGGTYFSQDFDSNSDIYVAEGSKFITNGKDAEFISDNKLKLTAIGVSSAMAKGGIEGMVSRQTGDGHASVYFDDEAFLSARNALFRVTDNTDIFNLAGAVMINSGVGAGVGAAITDYTKTNIVNIGDIDEIYQDRIDELSETDKDSTDNSIYSRSDGKVSVSENVNAEAKSTGDTTTIGVAGGITKNDDSGDDGIVDRMTDKFNGKIQKVSDSINNLSAKFGNNITNNINSETDKPGSHTNPSFALSAAGSLGLNFVKNTTKVDIKGATFDLGALADSNLNAVAINSSEVKAFAGAAGIMYQTRTPDGPSSPEGKTVGIAGAIGMNDIENITEASIENSVINQADKVKVFAVDGGQNIGMGLGLQIAVNSGSADGAYTMGSSVSVSSIENTVKSTFKDNTVNGTLGLKTDMNVAAYDRVKQITGGVSVTVGQQKGAIGAAVNVNNVKNELSALIEGGTYSNINDVKVSAMQALTQLNLGLTAGIIGGTPDTVAIMGAMIYNDVENVASAKIKDASFSTDGTVKVNSRDYKSDAAALSDFEALLDPVSNDVDQFVSTDGEDYYDVDTSNDVDGTNDPIANQELEGSLIVTGALAGTVSDTAVGAAVVINDLTNDFTSEIENSTIAANELEANASVNSKLISIAAGIAVSLNNGAGCGSVVYNDIDNTVNAGFLKSDITADQIKGQALNSSNLISVAGIVSAGAGKASVGMAAACNDITNNTNAYSYATKLTGKDASTSEVLIDATNNSKILNIAAALSLSAKVAVAGSVSVNEVTGNTLAKIDDSYTDEEDTEHTLSGMVISDLYRTKVSAEDNAKLTALAGNVAGGGTCGLGGSFSNSKIDGETGAYINDAELDSRRIEMYAYQNSIIHSWAEGVGGAGNVAVQGAASNNEIDRQITTKLNNSDINDSSISVFMGTHSSGNASSLAVAANGAGTAAIGAGVAVNRITDEVSSELTDSDLTLGHLSVKSKSDQTIEAIGVAGSGGGSAGVSGSVGYNRIRTTNSAFISENTIINANNNVGVIAQTDDVLMNYGGLLSIGGTAGVGAAFSGNTIEGNTQAYIEDSVVSALGLSGDITTSSEVADDAMNNAFIDDQTVNREYKLVDQREDITRTGLIVDSSSTHTMKSFVANAAGAGTVAFAGTVGVNSIEGNTEAYIKDASLNNGASAGNVYVDASDYTNYSSFVGSVGGAGTVGIGAAVSTNKTDRETSATIENINSGSKAKALSVNATGKQGISSIVAGLGVAGNVGIAGTVSTTNFDGETKSLINNANISVDSVEVKSQQFERSKVNNSTAGVAGFAGIGGSVAVGTDKHTVSSIIEDSSIALNTIGIGDITVDAENYTNFHTVAEAIGGGVVGVAGNVSVNNFENTVTAEVNSSSIGNTTNRAGQIDINAENDLNLTADLGSVGAGAVGAGCSVGVNSIDGKVRTQVDGSSLYSANNINISANENRTIDQKSFTAAAGSGPASVNVMWLSSGEVVSDDNEDGNQELHDAIDSAKEVNENTIDDDNDALTDEEQANMNGVGGSITADSAGKSATTIGIGDIFSGNSSTIDSSSGDVNISAKEDTTATMIGGNAAAGGAAAGASIATLKTNRNLGVTIHDAVINANTDIVVNAEVTGSSDLDMYQGTAGIFAAGTAAFGKVETTGNSVNTISDSDFTTNSGDINIEAKDTSSSSAKSYGLTAGTIAGGFLNTGIDNDGSTKINLNNNQMNADQNILIEAIKDNAVSANSVGGNVGILSSGIGVHSYVNDTSDSAITMTGSTSSFSGNDISFHAKNSPEIDSEATSGAVSFMYSAGVAVASTDIKSETTVNISDGNDFNATNVSFTGEIDGDSDVEAEGVSGGLVGSFGYNRSESSNNAKVNVLIGNNNYSSLTNLIVLGKNIVNQTADTFGLNIGGILASGNNKAQLTANTETNVSVTGNSSTANNVNSIDIKANSSSIHNVKANGDGGGLVSVDGLSAYAINDITSVTDAKLSGKWEIAETAKLFATQYDRVKINADSTKATLAGYSGTKAKNTIDSTTKTHLSDDSSIISGNDIDFGAINTISCNDKADDPTYAAEGSGYGGITVTGAKSEANITSKTEIKIGTNANIYADGSVIGDAQTIANVKNRVITKGAGLIANPLARNDTDFTIENKITANSGSSIRTKNALQDITLAASENLNLKITSDSDMQGGAGGDADAETDYSMTKTNQVEVSGDLYSSNDINLYTDMDSDGIASKYHLEATAYAYNKHSAVAIANADVNSSTNQTNKVIINSNADLSSVRHIKLGATPGWEVMTEESGEYTWHGDEEKGGYSSSSSGERSENLTSSNKVEIYGDLTAGIQNKVHMTLNGIVDIEGKAENSSLEPTVTSTIQDYEDQLEIGSIDYGNSLFDRYAEVKDLENEYAGTNAGIGYTAEKERLLNEMEKYGLYDSVNDIAVSGFTVQYIEFPSMVSSGGNIVINADNVTGGGTAKAQGSPEIIIENNTNLYTKVNNLDIVDYGGEIIYNDISLGDTASSKLSSLSEVQTNDSSDSLISVSQNWNGTVQVKDSNDVLQNLTPLSSIEINGRIDNPLGSVEISSSRGDIVIQGKTANDDASISGAEIYLTASNGTIAQGFTDSIVNIGGTPEDIYDSLADSFEDNHQEGGNTTVYDSQLSIDKTLQQGTWIAGGAVYVNASDININGLIQSGYSEYTLTLSAAAQTKIDDFDSAYDGSTITQDILTTQYKINEGGAKFDSGDDVFKYEVQAFYNPQTKEVILEDVDPQGGKIYLTGRISSTGNGRIYAADGSADININNATQNEIVLGKVNVGDQQGVIKITDTAKNQVTEFRRDSTTTYDIGSAVKNEVPGNIGYYAPESGMYYNWSTGYDDTEWAEYRKEIDFDFWGAWEKSSSSNMDSWNTTTNKKDGGNNQTNKITGTYIGTPSLSSTPGEYNMYYKRDIGYSNSTFNRWVTYDNWTHFSGTRKYKWGEEQGSTRVYQHSVYASNNIDINFIGSITGGSINVDSINNIVLNNNITGITQTTLGVTNSTSINLTTTSGSISQNAGRIIGSDVNITASTGIGNDSQINHKTLNDSLNSLSAITSSGDINIVSTASIGKTGDLFLNATTDDGDVSINNIGSINQYGLNGKVIGDKISLESQFGAIGQPGAFLEIEGGQTPNGADTMSASVNAQSRDGIYLNQQTGDMRIGKIYSDLGDVYLKVDNGSIHNVLPSNASTDESNELVDKWIEMGIINADGSNNEATVKAEAIQNYENGVRSEFENYKAQKEDYDNDSSLEKTDAYLDLESKYSSYANADAYLNTQDADSSSDYYKIKNNTYGWSKDQLLYAIQDSIINPTSGSSQTDERDANIKGKNIILQAENGGIGKDEDAEEISLINIGSNISDLKKIANSEASDVTWDDENNKATIKRTTPIGIQITDTDGSITAIANSNIYIAGSTEDPIYVNNINSSGDNNIRLLGKNGVYSTTVITGTSNFSGKDLIIEGGNSAIGTTDRPILIDSTGQFTARAEGLINIFQNSLNALNISAMYSGADITIQTLGDLFSVNSGNQAEDLGYINAASNLTLNSAGSIGEVGKGLRFLADNITNIEATGVNNLCLAGQSKSSVTNNLNLNFVTPVAGTIEVISATSNLILDSLTSAISAVNLVGKSLIQNAAIATADLSVTTANGTTINNADNLIAQANVTNTDSGNITLKSKSPVLVLKDVINNAESGNVNITSEFAIGALDTSDITSQGYLTIAANNGIMILNNLISGANILLDTDFAVTFNNATAIGGFISETSQLITHLGSLTAGGDVTLTSGVGVISNSSYVDGNLDITGPNIAINYAKAGKDLNLSADQTITSTDKLEAGTDLNVNAGELITLYKATAGNNITLNSQNNAVTVASTLDAGNNVDIDGTFITLNTNYGKNFDLFAKDGLLTIYRVDSTGNFIAKAINGLFTAMSLYVDNDVSISARDGAFACNYIEGNNINIAAKNIGLVKAVAENDITIETTNGSAIFSTLYGGNDVDININNGDGYAALINSGNNLTISSTGGENLTLGMGNAVNNMDISAGSSLFKAGLLAALNNLDVTAKTMEVLSAMAGNAGTITATDGDLLLVNGISNKDLTVNAEKGKLTAGSLITLNNLNVTAKEFTIGNALASGYKTDHMDFAIESDLTDILLADDFKFDDLNDIDPNHFTDMIQLDDIVALLEGGYQSDGLPVTFDEEKAREILNGYTGGNSVNLTALNGNANIGIAHASGDLSVTTENGEVQIGSLNAGKTLTLTAKNSTVTAGAILSLDTLNILADSMDILYAMTGEAASLIAENGNIRLVNGISNKNFTVEAQNGKVIAGSLITVNNLNVTGNELEIGNALAIGYKKDYLDFTVQKDILEAVFDTNIGLDASMEIDADALTILISEGLNNISKPELFFEITPEDLMNGFTGDNSINLIANNGNVNLELGLAVDDINVSAENGDVAAKEFIAGKNLKINANSANIHLAGSLENTSITTSEDMNLYGSSSKNNLALNSTNGKITAEILCAFNDLSVNSINGDIELTVAETDKGKVDIKTSGGSIFVNQEINSNTTLNVEASQGVTAKQITSNNKATLKNSNGIIDIENITTNNSDADIEITNANGDVQLTTTQAGRDLIVNVTNGDIGSNVITAGQNISMNATNITSQSSNANNDISMIATDNINTVNSNAGNDNSITSTAGDITVTDASANNDMRLDANGTTIEKAEAKNDLTINSGDVVITQAISGANMSVSADNEVAAQNLDAGTNLTITASGNINSVNSKAVGNIEMTSGKNIASNIINAGNSVTIKATDNILSESIIADKDININSQSIVSKFAKANQDINMNGQVVNSTKAEATRDIEFIATNNIDSEEIIAGNNIKLTATDNIESNTSNSGNNTTFVSTNGNISSVNSEAGNDSSMTSTGGNITVTEANANNDMSLSAAENIKVQTVEAKNNLSINGTKLAIKNAKSDANMTIESATSLNIEGLNAGENMGITVTGDLNCDNLTAGKDLSLSATENILSDNIIADQNIEMSATNIDSEYANAGKDIKFNASNNINSENLVSGNNISLSATGNIISNTSNSGNDTSFISTNGNIVVTQANAGNNIQIKATNETKSNISNSRNDISLASINGNITVTEANANNDISLDAAENIKVKTVKAQKDLSINGTNLNIDKAYSGANMAIKSGTSLKINGINSGLNMEITVTGDLNANELTAGKDISLSTTQNIISDNIIADQNIEMSATNINSKSANAGKDINFHVSNNIESENLISGNNISLSATENVISKASNSGNNTSFISSNGNIEVTKANSENNMNFEAANTVKLVNVEANNNIDIKASNVSMNKAKSGVDFKVESGNSIELDNFATDGNFEVTVKNGDINAKNVTAKGNIDLETLFGDILSENGTIESEQESINLIAQGKIDVHELLARKDISGLAKTDEIKLAKINGRKVTLVIKKEQKDITIDEANIEESLEITGDTVKIDKINHTSNTGIVNVSFTGIDNKALTEVEVNQISSNGGTHINGLWAMNAKIHSNTDYFYLKDVYLEEKGLLSNNNLTMSVYGQNPTLDGSDIVVFFAPTGSHRFTDISFQNATSESGRQTYVVFHASDDLPSVSKDMSNMDKISAETKSDEITLNSLGRQAFVSFERPYIANLISFSPANLISGQQISPFNNGLSLQNNQIIYVSSKNEDSEDQ